MRQLIFDAVLAPLIRRNYRLRELGELPDEWYWADRLAFSWGLAIDYKPQGSTATPPSKSSGG